MARPKDKPVHWICFTGSSPHEMLNSLWFRLRRGDLRPSVLSIFRDRSGHDCHTGLAPRLKVLLDAHGLDAALESIDCDTKSPVEFASALSGLLSAASEKGERLVLDLSPELPSWLPALTAQICAKRNDALLFCLHHASNDFRDAPLALIPRTVQHPLILQGGAPLEWGSSSHVPAPSAPSVSPASPPADHPVRHTWYLSRAEQMVLINALLDLGYDRNILIRFPLLKDLPLCRIHFRETGVGVTDFIRKKDYHRKLDQLPRSVSGRARRQIPDFDDLAQLLYASGVLRPFGLDLLNGELERIGSLPLDHGGDVYHIALDTNLRTLDLWEIMLTPARAFGPQRL